jgi:hypothetical protein
VIYSPRRAAPRCLKITYLFFKLRGRVNEPVIILRGCSYDPAYETSWLPRRIFPCVHMEYFVPLAEMKLPQCSSIIIA